MYNHLIPIHKGGHWLPLFLAGLIFLLLAGCSHEVQLPVTVPPEVASKSLQRTASIAYSGAPRFVGTALVLNATDLITNLHVIQARENQIRVSFDGKEFLAATVVRTDPEADLALLRISASDYSEDITEITAANPHPAPGTHIFAYGAAFGLHDSFFQGYVSHSSRSDIMGSNGKIAFVQIQGVTFPGMSGAPVFTLDGSFVGINRAAYGYAANTGTGLAIPADLVLDFAR